MRMILIPRFGTGARVPIDISRSYTYEYIAYAYTI